MLTTVDTFMVRHRQAREIIGLKQKAEGDAVGVKESTVSSWETGKKAVPEVPLLMQVATLLGKSIDWLLGVPGADPVHPGLRAAAAVIHQSLADCDATDPRARLLWCFRTAEAAGFGDVFNPVLAARMLRLNAEAADALHEHLPPDYPDSWAPMVCSILPISERWLVNGDASGWEAWAPAIGGMLAEKMILRDIDPQKVAANLPNHDHEIRRWAR